jgi:hypothetical protein
MATGLAFVLALPVVVLSIMQALDPEGIALPFGSPAGLSRCDDQPNRSAAEPIPQNRRQGHDRLLGIHA